MAIRNLFHRGDDSLFDIADVNKSASAFNGEKLAWLNQQHMMRAPRRDSSRRCAGIWSAPVSTRKTSAQLEQIVLAQRERAKTLKEMAANSVFFFRAPAAVRREGRAQACDPEILARCWRQRHRASSSACRVDGAGHSRAPERRGRTRGRGPRQACPADAPGHVRGTVSPPIDATLAILGKQETLRRLSRPGPWGAAAA
jgi:glutamyl-tRNA synthetase